eukprot:4950801-Prymnesium_polylepis.1
MCETCDSPPGGTTMFWAADGTSSSGTPSSKSSRLPTSFGSATSVRAMSGRTKGEWWFTPQGLCFNVNTEILG